MICGPFWRGNPRNTTDKFSSSDYAPGFQVTSERLIVNCDSSSLRNILNQAAMRSQLLALLVALLSTCCLAEKAELSCSASEQELDPALKEMTFDLGHGPETFLAYVQPDVTTFYRDIDPPASKPVRPKHNGFAGMFVNMSNKRIRLYWYVWVFRNVSVRCLFHKSDSYNPGQNHGTHYSPHSTF